MSEIAPSTSSHEIGDVIIEMRKVDKSYGNYKVLRGINLSVSRGERIVICGPSGSGKSTLIRCLNQLETHQAGEIVIEGTTVHAGLRGIDTIRREIGPDMIRTKETLT